MNVLHFEIEIVYISFLGAEVLFLFQRLRSRYYCYIVENQRMLKKIFIFIVCASEISIPIKLFFFHRKNMISKGIILSQRAVLSILIPCLQSNATCTCFILPRFIHVHVVCYDRAPKQLAFVRLAFFRQHYSTQIIMFIS